MRRRTLLAGMALSLTLSGFAEIPQGYYAGLDGKNGAELKSAAKSAVRTHTAISYGTKTWEAFETTDVRSIDGKTYWWDMYSNNLVEVSTGHTGLNIEHSVANSWWGKTQNDAYKDLFHLNPSDAEANNRKSYYPMGIVVDVTYDNGVTKVGHPASGDCYGSNWAYEPPQEYKGDFARAFFYIYTVYDDISWQADATDRNYMFDGSSYPSLRPWAYEMLLEWCKLDPVSEKEIARNEAIYEIQQNRNPFIDFPDLAEYIWGEKKKDSFAVDADHGGSDPVTPPGGEDPDTPDEPDYNPQGTGAEGTPYNVDHVLANGAGETQVWVQGYVVGYVSGYTFAEGCRFTSDTSDADYTNTNLLLAADKECRDYARCLPVQLPNKNNLRQELGLGNNPDIYGQEVKLLADISTYFAVPGLKNTTEYRLVNSGIQGVDYDLEGNWEICAIPGGVRLVSDRARDGVTIHHISGYAVWSGTARAGRTDVMLPAGTYVVTAKGQKAKKIRR